MKPKILLAFLLIVALTIFSTAAYAIHPACVIGQPGIDDLEDQIECAIQQGVGWLVDQQSDVNGSWENSVARTGFAVVKLEELAFELNYDSPFDEAYPYSQNVIAGLNYIFSRAATDGCGMHFEYQDTYDTGIAMMAIAAGRDMARTVSGGILDGMTYGAVLEANVDYFANSQRSTGTYEGGFYYSCGGGSGSADNSNSGYAVLGLRYAEAEGIAIPDSLKTHLNVWIDWVQNDQGAGDPADTPDPDGGSGYTSPTSWVNSLKTGNLLFEMAFVGDTSAVARAEYAIDYIARHWYDTTLVTGWGWDDPSGPAEAQYQAAYCLMKGLDSMGVLDDEIPGVENWFQDLADVIVAQQNDDGSWPSSPCYVWPNGNYGAMSGELLSTEWALLTLERIAPPPPVIQVSFDIKPGSCPNPVNVKSKGVLPAAIMGTNDFDVTQIDPDFLALRLKGTEEPFVSPLRWAIADVGEPFELLIGKEDCYEDCAGCSCPDGYLDLVFHFDTQEVVAVLGEVSDEDCLVLEIIGELKEEYNGTPIVGEDVVRILKKGKQ
jgi:hypothetical protein